MEKKCLQLIDEWTTEVVQSDALTQINASTVEKILKRETLTVKEIDLYKACIRWAEAECARQQIQVF